MSFILFNKQRKMCLKADAGLSLVELLVFIGVGSIMIVTLVAYVGRSFTISREQLEQGAITEKARVQMERMSDEIRNAQYVDCNMDGDMEDAGEQWLQKGEAMEIVIYSNVDSDVEAERVRYFVETGVSGEERKLKRGVTQKGATLCDFSGTERVRTVLDGLRNTDPNPDVPLFHYYTGESDATEAAVPVVVLSSILRVRLDLRVEESDVVRPGLAKVATDVVPRSIANPPACSYPGVQIYRYSYGDAAGFADVAFNKCQSTCATDPNPPINGCCAWSTSFLWQGNPNWYVWASCQCEDTYLPPDMTPETVNVGSYTDFVKECMGGTRCAGQIGNPICEAGCLDGPGQCVCVCPGGFESTMACSDGFDNDNDGTADCNGCTTAPSYPPDPGCVGANDNSETGNTQCDNGIDDDGDSYIDFKEDGSGDPGCTDPSDNDELPFDGPLPTGGGGLVYRRRIH